MRIVFIGPPGAGKGTQCAKLTRWLKTPHLSSGEMLRATKGQSALGRIVANYIDVGQLAPDYMVMRIVKRRLAEPDCLSGCLLDGFPRTLTQAQMLDDYLETKDDSLDLVLNLRVDQEELVSRLLKRATIEHREDDSEDTILARLRVFYTQTAPLLGYYRDRGIAEPIDGMPPPDTVFNEIKACVQRLK